MTRGALAMPQVLATALESDQMEEGFIGSVLRIDSEDPEVWWITLVKTEVGLPSVVRAFLVLLLDYQASFLPRILLPYQPPAALLTSDGQIVTRGSPDVRRDWLAILRSMKVDVVPTHREFFTSLEVCLRSGEGYDVVGAAEPFFRPGLTTRHGPPVPKAMLEQGRHRRG